MRLLGLDYGSSRIGVAMGDTETRVAGPLETIRHTGPDEAVQRVQEMALSEGIDRLVVGVPRSLSEPGRETDQAKEIRAFIEALRVEGLDVVEEDESLSTALAARLASDAGVKGKRDDLAASAILQTYLDRISNLES